MFLPTMRALLSRKKPVISFVLDRPRLHLGVGGEGRNQAGGALMKSRQSLAALWKSLMRISQHVVNTCCSLMLPSGDVGARRMAASGTRAFLPRGAQSGACPQHPLVPWGCDPLLLAMGAA